MSGKIHIPAKQRSRLGKRNDVNTVIKVTPEAYNALVDVLEETNLSLRQLASSIILQGIELIVYDREEDD